MPDWEAPLDGWLVVRIDGERITKVEVETGDQIELELETDTDTDEG